MQATNQWTIDTIDKKKTFFRSCSHLFFVSTVTFVVLSERNLIFLHEKLSRHFKVTAANVHLTI